MQPPDSEDSHEVQDTFSQRTFFDGALGQEERERQSSNRIAVRFISRRCRLIDPDNLTPKYLLDGLRYAGLLYDDRAQDITVSCEQEKANSKAEEETVIEIEYIDESQISNLLDRAKAGKVLVLREKDESGSQ